jgi:O-acetyl-ADP-ribose deacetylase (regulator of RNase III)
MMVMRREVRVERCSLLDAGCDIVVNASNPAGALGSGVSRAIFEECGGLLLQEEVRAKLEEEFDGKLDIGECLVTSGGSSRRIRHVLHVASVDYGASGKGLVSDTERVAKATEAALERAASLGTADAPTRVAFPLLAAGHGGLSTGVSLKAMVDGMKSFFRENPDAPVGHIVLAVPEADKYELAKSRLEQLLVLR